MITGTYTALVTPFNKDFSLDLEGLIQNIEEQISQGVDGIVLLGSTGENPALTCQEKEILIQTAVKTVAKRVHLMVGTGTNSTASTIEQTLLAKELGADSALVVCPYYNKPTQAGLLKHFEIVAAKTQFPICLYNVPGRTQVNLQPSTLKELLDVETIVSIKEASGNILQIMEMLELIQSERKDFTLLSGDDALTFPLMCLGAHGVISVASNLLPARLVNLVKLTLTKMYDAARKEHFKLLDLFQTLFIESNPIPIKAAMNLLEKPAGPCRLPLCDLSAQAETKLIHCLNKYSRFYHKIEI